MTKNELLQYRHMQKELKTIQREINKIRKKQAALPVVKDKVQASLDEFPYTEIHVSVDAVDPIRNLTYERLLWKKRMLIDDLNKRILDIETWIDSLEDSRARRIFRAVFMQGKSYQSIASELEITPGRVSQIIRQELEREE